MRVRLKLKPGQRGTKRLTKQYGDSLVCVRYRYDEKTRKRYTTVELIVAEKPWQPPAIKSDTIVHLKIAFDEMDLRQKIKAAGAWWNTSTKLWRVPYKTACKLGLKERIAGIEEDKKGEK